MPKTIKTGRRYWVVEIKNPVRWWPVVIHPVSEHNAIESYNHGNRDCNLQFSHLEKHGLARITEVYTEAEK